MIRRFLSQLIVLVCAAAVCIQPASVVAQPQPVTWHVDDSAAPGGTGQSWASPLNDLQAVLTSDDLEEGHTIKVAQGQYMPHAIDRAVSFKLKTGVKMFGGYYGPNSEGINPDERKPLEWWSKLSGNIGSDIDPFDNSLHVVFADDPLMDPNNTVLDGFGIVDGLADPLLMPSPPTHAQNGAGIYLYRAAPKIVNCFLMANDSIGPGGGIACMDSEVPVEIRNCRITGNSSGDVATGFGGVGGGVLITRQTSLINCLIMANNAEHGGGVAVFTEPLTVASLTMVNCTVRGNNSQGDFASGGGIAVDSGNGSVTMINCEVTSNYAGNTGGGMVVSRSLNMTNCTVANNESAAGGGLAYSGPTAAMLRSSIFWGNEATRLANTNDIWVISPVALTFTKVGGIDPLFVNAAGDDGIFGNADDNHRLACGSPCIDAGDDLANPQANQPSGSGGIAEDTFDVDGNGNVTEKTPDIDKAQRIYGARLDQGTFETHSDATCPGDLHPFGTGNGVVDIDDLLQIVNYWGDHGGPVDVFPGCGGNGVVDVDDLLLVLNGWGACSAPAGPPAGVWDCYVRCSGLELTDVGFCLQKCVENLE